MTSVHNLTSKTLLVIKQRKIYELPEDILAEILVRLPVKYILRCMCVQKSWYYLIHTPMFITIHLNHQKSSTRKHNAYLFFSNLRKYFELKLNFDDEQCKEYLTIDKLPPALSRINGSGQYLLRLDWYALSYGLICLKTVDFSGLRRIYLWNPLVQKDKILPHSPLPTYSAQCTLWEALAFGFVPGLNDHVVVHVVKPNWCVERAPHPHSVFIGVYSLNTNSWKKISLDIVLVTKIESASDVFVNGTAFWVGRNLDKDMIVMYFDTKTSILGEILLPKWTPSSDCPGIRIHPFGQSIAYFVKRWNYKYSDDWNMRVLEGDLINEFSWKKKNFRTSKDVQGGVLGLRNNGEPILQVQQSCNLISFKLDDDEQSDFYHMCIGWSTRCPFKTCPSEEAPCSVGPFVESLVFLDMKEMKNKASDEAK